MPERPLSEQPQSEACTGDASLEAAHDAGWDAGLLRAAGQARALARFSLAWMCGEGVLGLVAGFTAGSIALVGWALGSVIEGLASIIVLWRFTGSRTLSETSERRAQQAGAVSFAPLRPQQCRSVWL